MADKKLDRRLHPYRDDLAAKHLEGQVNATRFTEGVPMQVIFPVSSIHSKPDERASIDNELLFGETVIVFEDLNGWAWIQADHDGYVGYVNSESLTEGVIPPSHLVNAQSSFVYEKADFKQPPLFALPFGAKVTVPNIKALQKGFVQMDNGGWIYANHLTDVKDLDPDFVATAERFMHVPYLWGGRSTYGLDCSALVQLSLARAGIDCPRDTDMQEGGDLGEEVAKDKLQRGDIVFFPRHVGIMLDEKTLLNANATHMKVTADPVENVAAITKKQDGKGITSVRRVKYKGPGF